jgi:hypothetical protein
MENKKILFVILAIFLFPIALIPQESFCQEQYPIVPTPGTTSTATLSPTPTTTASPTLSPEETSEPFESTIPSGTRLYPTPKSGAAGLNYALVGGVAIVVIAVVGVLFVAVKKRRVSERSLRRYSSQDFQNWVLKRIDGKASTSRDIAMGIDGFTARGYPLSIKQSDSVGMIEIDRFASTLAKNRARNGVIVAFGFGSDAVRGKVRAKTSYGLDIEMLTINDLIYTRRPY